MAKTAKKSSSTAAAKNKTNAALVEQSTRKTKVQSATVVNDSMLRTVDDIIAEATSKKRKVVSKPRTTQKKSSSLGKTFAKFVEVINSMTPDLTDQMELDDKDKARLNTLRNALGDKKNNRIGLLKYSSAFISAVLRQAAGSDDEVSKTFRQFFGHFLNLYSSPFTKKTLLRK
ncbi:MAG: hypothetical protein JSS82_00120 [Bacteroidetes bacterium]|nr:hypothetical protein [Bacteroidota bacterium]